MNAFTLPGTDGIFIQGKLYSKKKLCLDWFQMSNDAFYDLYGFTNSCEELVSRIYDNAINAACEAIQVAAMCKKFLEMEGKQYDN